MTMSAGSKLGPYEIPTAVGAGGMGEGPCHDLAIRSAGLVGVGSVLIAPDGDHYVYRYSRQLSELFIVNLAGR
jgi:hypothetical protein